MVRQSTFRPAAAAAGAAVVLAFHPPTGTGGAPCSSCAWRGGELERRREA